MFVTVEGIDGTGKSTLARALAKRLADELGEERIVLTREPTESSPWGRRLREAAERQRLSREEEIDHFHRDRLHHLETLIRPALEQGKIVICDRYVDSFLAYQAKDPGDADRLYAEMAPALVAPDLVLLLDCPVEVALRRIELSRSGQSRFEQAETLRKAREIYASRKGLRYHRIDAARPPEEVLGEALTIVRAQLARSAGER